MLLCKGSWLPSERRGVGDRNEGVGLVLCINRNQHWQHLLRYPVSFWVFSGQQNCISKVGIEGIIGTGEGKQNQGGFFLQFLDFSTLPHCSAVYLWWLCCGEEEMLSWRLYLIGVNVNLM